MQPHSDALLIPSFISLFAITMPIPVTCSCGASFAAGDHLAGKRVQCPKCKNPLAIPTPAAADDDDDFKMEAPIQKPAVMAASIFDQAGMQGLKEGQINCPGCEAPIAATAVLCVKCGYHVQMGKKITGAKVKKSGGDGHANIADDLLEKARDNIDADKESKKNEEQDGMPWYILAGIFLFATSFLIMMLALPGEQAFIAGGSVIILASTLGGIYYQIRIIMLAFAEGLPTGLMYLFLPFYAIYYWIRRWDICGPYVATIFLLYFVQLIGTGMLYIAPWMRPEEDKKGGGSARPTIERVETFIA